MFSKTCEYSIRALIFVAMQSSFHKRVSLNDIAQEINSPVSFTAKILQKLVKSELLSSLKGPTGGFVINEARAGEITLSQIVSAIDGDSIYKGCGLGLENCNELRPCPVHHKFKIVREELRVMLEQTTLKELASGIPDGLTFLKRAE